MLQHTVIVWKYLTAYCTNMEVFDHSRQCRISYIILDIGTRILGTFKKKYLYNEIKENFIFLKEPFFSNQEQKSKPLKILIFLRK